MNQKVQSVIKVFSINYIFLVISFIFFNQALGQDSLTGKYCFEYKTKDFSKCINLKSNNEFDIVTLKHIGKNQIIQGKWFINENKIILKYNEPELINFFNINAYSKSTLNDSVKITFRVKDFNLGPTLGLFIKIPSKKIVLQADSKGVAELKMKKSTSILSGHTEYIGYENCFFSFDLTKDYLLELFISEKQNETLVKQNDTLLISQNKKYFVNIRNRIKEKWKKH